ncbi:hypothetical protein Q664_04650 [Archangium violaceum Cb vi76]|uniref:Uncharacterized protein n=1 Tax=Archangium violaceum Cb vi76 TaxID=1406225 RepID=A0A084T0H7_9BACT|nr:hypothetical protein Q664_04650 [Archangium violaceum Cb vi76]
MACVEGHGHLRPLVGLPALPGVVGGGSVPGVLAPGKREDTYLAMLHLALGIITWFHNLLPA